MSQKKIYTLIFFLLIFFYYSQAQQRPREFGIQIGVLSTGENNAITDVKGVKVGHHTLIKGDSVRTGVTAILPHEGNVFQEKVPAAIYIGNGFGKLMGISQVKELGNIETPIILTNTLNVPLVANAVIDYVLAQEGNESVRSVNAVVGETNDGRLNDIRNRHVTSEHVLDAISQATSGKVAEGNVGAGTGTVCFGFKGGIGTSSRVLPESVGGYTVGVLVQSNFGGVLQIDGVPIGVELDRYYLKGRLNDDADGSIMMIVATDAPLDSRNLERLAKRAIMGLAKSGGIASNGSGDYVIAFSTHPDARVLYIAKAPIQRVPTLHNDYLSPLFMATIEATEEAIINSLFAAKTTTSNGYTIEELPVDKVLELMKKYNRLNK
ncbi:MAG: P1 family peptidase [Bacteroidota bacterium]